MKSRSKLNHKALVKWLQAAGRTWLQLWKLLVVHLHLLQVEEERVKLFFMNLWCKNAQRETRESFADQLFVSTNNTHVRVSNVFHQTGIKISWKEFFSMKQRFFTTYY